MIERGGDEAYKLRILGPQILAEASLLFSEINVCSEHGIDYFHHVKVRSLRERGLLIAAYRQRKMLEVVELHTAENKRKGIGRTQPGEVATGQAQPKAAARPSPPKARRTAAKGRRRGR